MPAIKLATSVDPETLWQELVDVTFDVDEFLDNFIKLHAFTLKPLASFNSDMSVGSKPSDPSVVEIKDVFLAVQEISLTDVQTNETYDTSRILNGLNDLFDACVFINSKAAYQHNHAEEELREVEDEATDQLQTRLDKVKLSLREVEKLEDELKDLSRNLNFVGDKISSITRPEERLTEAHRLLTCFVELDSEPLVNLTYPELLQKRTTLEDYQKAARIILGLHKTATALTVHQDGVYKLACERIAALYKEIENDLVILFARAYEQEPFDVILMQQISVILQNFPGGFSLTISDFVDRAVKLVANVSNDPFRHIIQVCDATYKLIYEVFPGPNVVMEKFITQVVCQELEPLVQTNLNAPKTIANLDTYLHNFYDLYRRTRALEPALAKFKSLRMPNIIHALFGYHIDGYAETEIKFLKTRSDYLMQQYYDVLGADLGIAHVGTVQMQQSQKDFLVITLGAPKTVAENISDFLESHPNVAYDNKLIRETLCLGLLQELRQSANRATTLIPSDDLGPCLLQLGDIVATDIVNIHLDCGMEIGIRTLPPTDPKIEPNLCFLKLVQKASAIFDLLTLQIHDCLKKLERFKVEYKTLEEKLQTGRDRIEKKALIGIEGCLNSAMNYIRYLFSQQNKLEFHDLTYGFKATATAVKVTDFFVKLVQQINDTTSGKNHWNLSAEVGMRFHREVIDHFDDFKFSCEEAMILICDIKEYREAVILLNVDETTKLFDEMLLLANLLIADSKNLLQLCREILKDVNSLESISYMLKLREDFKSISDLVPDYV